jgi:hypothetical protein
VTRVPQHLVFDNNLEITMKKWIRLPLLSVLAVLATSGLRPALAHGTPSGASALSLVPVAVSVAAPLGLFSAGAVALTVVGVEVAEGASGATVWVLERSSDGARASLRLSGQVAGAASVVAGTAVVATTFSAGVVLSAAGKAIAFIPSQVGQGLLYNERITP